MNRKRNEHNKEHKYCSNALPLFVKTATPLERATIQLLFSMGTSLSGDVSLRCQHIRPDFQRLAVDEKQTEALQAYFSKRQQTSTEEGAKQ
jgi:hypothetical protein